MKAVIQRVLSASVTVDGKIISEIGRGLCCLIGLGTDDTMSDVDYIANKILAVRAFPSSFASAENEWKEEKAWSKNVKDIDGEVLCVSQFTLHASTRKGAKPDFHGAMSTEPSREMYSKFLEKMEGLYEKGKIKNGQFGAMMNVALVNEGPVTLILDSRESSGSSTPKDSKDEEARLKAEQLRLAKEKKREENEARTRENKAKKEEKEREFRERQRMERKVEEGEEGKETNV